MGSYQTLFDVALAITDEWIQRDDSMPIKPQDWLRWYRGRQKQMTENATPVPAAPKTIEDRLTDLEKRVGDLESANHGETIADLAKRLDDAGILREEGNASATDPTPEK